MSHKIQSATMLDPLKIQAIYKAFALTGRLADCYYTQGDALG